MKYDYLVVGAGLAGAVLAERLANELGANVLLVEKRDHIAGNAYDFPNQEGIMVQAYGPHIFHTTDKAVWDYLGQFTPWNDYVHRVQAMVNGKTVFEMEPGTFAAGIAECLNAGARILGGCCGTTPEHIRAVAALLKNT